MSRGRLLIGIAAAALTAALVLLREGTPSAAPRPAESPPEPAARPASNPVPSVSSGPLRNVFEYARDPEPPGAAPPPAQSRSAPVATPAPSSDPAPAAVRLVGLVRRGGRLDAALSIHGALFVLAVGEEGGGYRVDAIEEDEGVRLKGPDGTITVLTPP